MELNHRKNLWWEVEKLSEIYSTSLQQSLMDGKNDFGGIVEFQPSSFSVVIWKKEKP